MPNNGPQSGIRKPRKSRGRGLRTNTGCLICKRRHVKCDEVRPQCGPCAKGQRSCVYGDGIDTSSHASISTTPSQDIPTVISSQAQIHEPLQVLVDACHQEHAIQPSNFTQTLAPNRSAHRPISSRSVSSPLREYVPSPGTESSATSSRVAPLSWFELLAQDAANADREFLLSPQQRFPLPTADEASISSAQSPAFEPRTLRERESFQAAAFHHDPEMGKKVPLVAIDEQSQALPDVPSSWSTSAPIQLSEQEFRLFTHFVQTFSGWLDFFDSSQQFCSVVPHLALRNTGLMKALLALSARHLTLLRETPGDRRDSDSSYPVDRNAAVRYYYETLHYLNKAMRYQSYAGSQELISTALLISTYEMIDGSNRDWERHLKGVFWIQRYQNNHGECGGLRQAVWWAWLRQDVWVAMRERRRVFSFWRPQKHVSVLTIPELTTRAIYLLAQCVNYASREESESTDLEQRLERGNELLYMLQEWQDCLPREFTPLPVPSSSDVFPPIWVNPPPCAAALQFHSLARIIVILHRPSIGGLQDYRAAQKLLTSSLCTICGIARMNDENDDMAFSVSLQCLYGAGLGVHTPHERAALLDLLDKCQRRIRWPADSLTKELEAEYQKDELSAFAR
ncbi:fungal-specific transcription factor domain-containing protein [Aspergillus parasiticus]|uniref:Fungal-specific transcription factor domain-containing protein n=2 Tax=Aspergillus subgen. Circumdati TaxID=2720871 RepID=A0A5N6DSU1_ASPPA|nr:fungal-specific transcription factor domain-containing protein [Aspergillus parasiticus]KAE8314916.1 fungal-specific transcription factor domain-containing protein [Aspergillus transmontanensis]